MDAPLTRFGAHLRERGWGYPRFRREYEAAAARLRLDGLTVQKKQFQRWRIAGQVKTAPRADASEVLEAMFDEPVRILFAAARPLTDSITESDVTTRRAVLQGIAGGVAGLDVIENARRLMDQALDSTNVGSATLDRWERTAMEYAHAYQISPPGELLRDIMDDVADLHRLLAQRQPARARQRLCRVAGQLAALAGTCLSQLGEHRAARAWFHTGRIAAVEAADTHLEGLLLVRSAIVALYYGTPTSALEQAVQVRAQLPGTVCPATVRALLVESRALARLGQPERALQRVRQAEEGFTALTADDRSDTVFGYTNRQFDFHLGTAYTLCGLTNQARDAQDRALDAYAPTELLDPTLIRLDRATCLGHDGEPDQAYELATDVLRRLPDVHRKGLVLRYARDFARSTPNASPKLAAEFTRIVQA